MKIKVIQIISKFGLIFLPLYFVLYVTQTSAGQEPDIRVLITRSKNLRIRSNKTIPLKIKDDNNFTKRVKGITIKQFQDKTTLTFDRNKEKVYELEKWQRFSVSSSDHKGIWVGQKRYSGVIDIYVLDSGIIVVNEISIENYLNSVVGSEMPYKWPVEALRAQAIASRTYALKQKGNQLYDIDSTQKNQVYNGLESRTINTRRAVKSTRSLVLVHNNKLINALFHSSSGGMTEDSHNVWDKEVPYLKSVKDFDYNNPKLIWQKRFSQKQLDSLFPSLGSIQNIDIKAITKTGRIRSLILVGENGNKEITGREMRNKMDLKSTLVRFKFIENNGSDDLTNTIEKELIVSGMGSGHAVGMSQWGARFMAKKGDKAEKILKHFYKNVEIKPFQSSFR